MLICCSWCGGTATTALRALIFLVLAAICCSGNVDGVSGQCDQLGHMNGCSEATMMEDSIADLLDEVEFAEEQHMDAQRVHLLQTRLKHPQLSGEGGQRSELRYADQSQPKTIDEAAQSTLVSWPSVQRTVSSHVDDRADSNGAEVSNAAADGVESQSAARDAKLSQLSTFSFQSEVRVGASSAKDASQPVQTVAKHSRNEAIVNGAAAVAAKQGVGAGGSEEHKLTAFGAARLFSISPRRISLASLSVCAFAAMVCFMRNVSLYWDLAPLLKRHPAKALARSVSGLRNIEDEEAEEALDEQLPHVCPPFLKLEPGVTLALPTAHFGAFTWNVDIATAQPSASSADSPRLSASLRWAKREGRVGRVIEVSALGPNGPEPVVSCSSSLEVELAGGDIYGWLRLVSVGRYVLRAVDGETVMALSCDHSSRRIEMASLPEGLLVATAERTGGTGGEVESLQVSTRRGADVVFALVCALAVTVFSPPRKQVSAITSESPSYEYGTGLKQDPGLQQLDTPRSPSKVVEPDVFAPAIPAAG